MQLQVTAFINYLNNNLGALELDITPNRPDCFSHLGVARDLAAKLNIDIHTPSYDKKSFSKNIVKDMINISLEDPEDCPRYIAGIVKDVKGWTFSRLVKAQARINWAKKYK